MRIIRKTLKKLKEMGYVILVEHNVWIVKELASGKIIKEVHLMDLSKRNSEINKIYVELVREKFDEFPNL